MILIDTFFINNNRNHSIQDLITRKALHPFLRVYFVKYQVKIFSINSMCVVN